MPGPPYIIVEYPLTIYRNFLATPLVTGVLASFVLQGISNPVEHMMKLAYARVRGGPKVVYNGVPESEHGNAIWAS